VPLIHGNNVHGISLKKLHDDVTLFVLRDKGPADNYKTWWKFVWKHCETPPGTTKENVKIV